MAEYTDITKTGAQGYKDLQRQNNLQNEEKVSLDQFGKNFVPIASNYGYRPMRPQIDSGQNIGTSKYDQSVPYFTGADLDNVEDIRAQNQGIFDTVGNGIAKFAGKVGTTIIGTFAGIPAGIGTAIYEGRWSGLWDNEVTNSLADFDEYMESKFKNYKTNAQQNSSWFSWENFTSAGFWMDDVLTNAGFTVGALLTGNMVGGALGFAANLIKGANIAARSQKAASLIASFVSATAEGSIEAKQASKEYKERSKALIDNEFSRKFQELENSGLTDREYFDKKRELENQYKASLEQVNEESLNIGNMVLGGNQVLLTFGNMIQFGKSFSKSFTNAARLENSLNKSLGSSSIKSTGKRSMSEAADFMGEKMAKNGGKATAEMVKEAGVQVERVSPFLGRTRALTRGIITEGSEEMNQQWITSGAESFYENRHKDIDSYWRDRLNPPVKDFESTFSEFGQAVMDGFDKSWGDFEQWEQFLIGGMMGAGGVWAPTKLFNQDKSKKWYDPRRYGSWEGGAINDLIEYNKAQSNAEGNAKKLNELLATEKFWNHWYNTKKDLATLLAIQNRQDEHLEDEDKKSYKDDEDDYFAHVIGMFSRAGKLEDLRTIYNSHKDLSDEEIDAIVKNSTTVTAGTEKQKKELEEAKKRKQTALATVANLQEIYTDWAAAGNAKQAEVAKKQLEQTEKEVAEIDKQIEEIKNKKYNDIYVGTYVDTNGNRIKTNEEIRNELNDISKSINQKIEDYAEAAATVQYYTKGKFSDEEDDVLTYAAFISKESLNRATKIFNNSPFTPVKFTIANLPGKEGKLLKTLEEIKKALDLEASDIVENKDGTFTIDTSMMSQERKMELFSKTNSTQENIDITNDAFSRIAASKGLKPGNEDYEKAAEDINDFYRLMYDSKGFHALLTAYRLKHGLIEQDKNKVKAEEESKNRKKATNDFVAGKGLSDILKGMRDQEIPDDLVIDDLDEELRKDYETAQKIYAKYQSISEAIESNELLNEVERAVAQGLLDEKYEQAENAEALMGITPEDIEKITQDDILSITGFDSIEELLDAVEMSDKVDASNPDALEEFISATKSGILEAIDKAVSEEEKKDKKNGTEPKKRTVEERKEGGKGQSDTAGKDGPITTSPTVRSKEIDLGEKIINKKSRKVRAINNAVVGENKNVNISFQYDSDGKWKTAYVEIPVSFFKELGKGIKNNKGEHITLDSISEGGKIKVVAIKSEKIDGNLVHYAEITTSGKPSTLAQAHYRTRDGKRFKKPLKVYLNSSASIDEMLGVAEGTFSPVKAQGTPLVVRSVGNKEDEEAIKEEAKEDAKKRSKKEADSTDKKQVVKPNSTMFYIHPFQSSGNIYKPYWEIEDDFSKTPEAERIIPVQINGKTIKISKKAAIHKAIHDFLLNHGAFERQNQMKPGDEITFGFSKELNDSLPTGSSPILLMFDKDGNVVGDLASPIDSNTFDKNSNISNLYNYALNNLMPYEGHAGLSIVTTSTDKGKAPLTTQVANKYIGVPHFGQEYKSVPEALTTKKSDGTAVPDFEIAIAMGGRSNYKMKTSNGAEVNTPNSVSAGKPYVLIHTSDPQRPWYPISILMNTLNAEGIKGTDFYKILINQLGKIKKAAEENKFESFKDTIRDYLALNEKEFYIDKQQDGSITIKIKGSIVSTISAEDLKLTAGELGKKIIEDLSKSSQPITINVSKNLFGTTYTLLDSETNEYTVSYKDIISPLMYINAVSNQTVNDFFDLNPILFDGKGNPSVGKATKLKPAKEVGVRPGTDKKGPTKDNPKNTVKAGYYYKEGDTIIVCDSKGNPLTITDSTPEKEALNIAYTYVLAQGFTKDGEYDVPFLGGKTLVVEGSNLSWGKEPVSKNPTTNDFVRQFQKDQDEVVREETDAEHYIIKVQGSPQSFKRLHSVIDAIYGEMVKLEDTQKIALVNIEKTLKKTIESGVTITDIINNIDTYLPFLTEEQRLTIAGEYSFLEDNDVSDSIIKNFINDVLQFAKDSATGFKGTRSLKVGTAVDEIVREFFNKNGTLPEKNTHPYQLSDNAYTELRLALDNFYKEHSKKYSFVSDKLVVSGNINGVDIAGEIDLLAIDKETGEIEIWDIKTSSRSFVNEDGTTTTSFAEKSEKFTRSSKEQYTIQLNAYKELIEAKYGIKIKGLKILPLFVKYSDSGSGSKVSTMAMQSLIKLESRDGVLNKPARNDPKEGNPPENLPPKFIPPKAELASWNKNEAEEKLKLLIGARSSKTISAVLEELDKLDPELKDKVATFLSRKNRKGLYLNKTAKKIIGDIIIESKKIKAPIEIDPNDVGFIEDGQEGQEIPEAKKSKIVTSKIIAAISNNDLIYSWDEVLQILNKSKYKDLLTTLLESIKKRNPNAENLLKTILVYKVDLSGLKSRGATVNTIIAIDPNKVQNEEDLARILMHELIHTFTTFEYRTNKEFKDEIDRIYKKVLNFFASHEDLKNDIQMQYGFKNVYEFMAEALSNPNFMYTLEHTPDPDYKKESLWHRFLNAILKAFGISVTEGTALSSTLNEVLKHANIYDFKAFSKIPKVNNIHFEEGESFKNIEEHPQRKMAQVATHYGITIREFREQPQKAQEDMEACFIG